ncbi:MAG: NUDIX domain-containing protein [Treponema sp.]|nr:NUDIX domain-containing protein [Treponema sp.]
MNDFLLCPKCASKKIKSVDGRKWQCPDCGFDLYNNTASAVGIIISDKKNSVLLERRAKDPRKGFLALPGGFVDYDETAEDAARRECLEELALPVENIQYVCSYPNTYEYKNIVYKTCDLFFSATPNSIENIFEKLHFQKAEVSELLLCKINTLEDIQNLPLAFESARFALKIWLEKRQNKNG